MDACVAGTHGTDGADDVAAAAGCVYLVGGREQAEGVESVGYPAHADEDTGEDVEEGERVASHGG